MGVLERAAVESWPSWQAPSAWQADAACRGLPLDVFFPDGTGASKFEQAKTICAGCPVIADCRAMTERAERSLSQSYVHGVFAGESPLERVRRRRIEASPIMSGDPERRRLDVTSPCSFSSR